MTTLHLRTAMAVAALYLAAAAPPVPAQQPFPVKPIRVVIPYPPGGTADIVARAVGLRLTAAWGQQIVYDYRPGASGNIGTVVAVKANPDGHTLALGTVGNLTINPSLFESMPYDVLRDLAPVSNVAAVPNILVVRTGALPVKSVADLVALAKSRPGQLTFGSSGNGTTLQFNGELLKKISGIDIAHVPYKGIAPALTGLLSGEISMLFATLPAAVPHIQSGRLSALAVTSRKRMGMLPEIGTVAELGFRDLEVVSWYGILAPAQTPRPVVAKLAGEIGRMLKTPEMLGFLADQGAEPIGDTPEQFGRQIRDDLAKWKNLVKSAGITAN